MRTVSINKSATNVGSTWSRAQADKSQFRASFVSSDIKHAKYVE